MKLILPLICLVTVTQGFAPLLHSRTKIQLANNKKSSGSSHQDLFDSEEAAAVDAHDISDPGMEAAAMERSAMLAEKMIKEMKNAKKKTHPVEAPRRSDGNRGRLHLHKSILAHEDLYNAEEAAYVDAHDVSDAGMEAAAMERAVMLADDILKKKKKVN